MKSLPLTLAVLSAAACAPEPDIDAEGASSRTDPLLAIEERDSGPREPDPASPWHASVALAQGSLRVDYRQLEPLNAEALLHVVVAGLEGIFEGTICTQSTADAPTGTLNCLLPKAWIPVRSAARLTARPLLALTDRAFVFSSDDPAEFIVLPSLERSFIAITPDDWSPSGELDQPGVTIRYGSDNDTEQSFGSSDEPH
jgi:hypothetical protein